MAFSRVVLNYEGSNTFAVNFTLGYISPDHVTARVNDEVDGAGDPVYRTLTWLTEGTVIVGGTLEDGDVVTFERTTPKDELTNVYIDGDILDDENIDESFKQAIMIAHEVLDGRLGIVGDNIDMGQNRITNLADGIDDNDAATAGQINAVIGDAQDWATKVDGIVDSTDYSSKAWAVGGTGLTAGASKEWAITAEDTLVDGVDYSAKHYAAKTAADATSTAADVVSTNADAVSTAADVLTTNVNASYTAADVILANKWAEEAEDVEVVTGEYSAYHWAKKAESFAAGTAATINYDNAASGFTATNVQAAIDEIDTTLDGLGSLATQNTVDNTDWSGADLEITNGGTGASSAPAARTNLDVYSTTEVDDAIDAAAEKDVVHVQDQKSPGTDGGAQSSGAWRTRTLNTVVTNTVSGASLSSNQVTLPAGTYEVWGCAPAYRVGQNQIALYNVTDSSFPVLGAVVYADAPNLGASNSMLMGKFTIAGTKAFELQHYSQGSQTGNGAGVGSGFSGSGQNNVFGQLFFRKVS